MATQLSLDLRTGVFTARKFCLAPYTNEAEDLRYGVSHFMNLVISENGVLSWSQVDDLPTRLNP